MEEHSLLIQGYEVLTIIPQFKISQGDLWHINETFDWYIQGQKLVSYYIPVQVNSVFRVPGCPVQELRAVKQLVLLSLFPTGTLIILPMVIRAS